MKDSIEKLLQELEDNHDILSVKSYIQYKKNGVIVDLKRVDTGFTFNRALILSDGSTVIAWMWP